MNYSKLIDGQLRLLDIWSNRNEADEVLAGPLEGRELYDALDVLVKKAEARWYTAYNAAFFKKYPKPLYMGGTWDD